MASDPTGIVILTWAAEVGMSERDRRDDGRPEQARPRDRTGRPLPYGTEGVATTEPLEPLDVEHAIELGARRWAEQRYFEAHELLEVAWKAATGPERELWKGVIQLAVACVHVQRGNLVGAGRLVTRGLRRLERAPDHHRAIDVVEVRRQGRALAGRIEAGQPVDVDLGPLPLGAS